MKIIEQMNCKWEGMENQPYFAIDVPPKVNYNEIKKFLNNELDNKVLDFKEACLGENHI